MLSLGGGPRRANSYLFDGVPITDLFNRAAIDPVDRGGGGSQSPGRDLRRRTGPDGRRRLQHHASIGIECAGTGARFFSSGRNGARANCSSPARTTSEARDVLPPVGRVASAGRSQESHVFLGEHRRVQDPDDGNMVLTLPTARERRGDFSHRRPPGPADHHLRPADDATDRAPGAVHPRPVSRQHHSGRSINPVARTW